MGDVGNGVTRDHVLVSRCFQIATLNFLDAFLRIRSQVLVPRDAFTAVELWMGVLHVYTCQDSLSTCQVRETVMLSPSYPPTVLPT